MAGRLPTGIDDLDRKIDGGLPAGSIVALTAAPASQAELVLYELTAVRGTLYLTTQRSDQAVADAIDRTPASTGSPTVRDVAGGEALDDANQLIRALPEGSNLVIDTVDPLEAKDAARYRNFLNQLQTQMVNLDSVAVLHCLDGRAVPENRDITEHMADVVFSLTTEAVGDRIENRLTVPKFRGGVAPEEAIKLELAEEVAIDTSRDIA